MEIVLTISVLVAVAYLLLSMRSRMGLRELFYNETRDGSLHPSLEPERAPENHEEYQRVS